MTRLQTWTTRIARGAGPFFLWLLLAQLALAQGVLIVIDPPHPVPLPRPIIFQPPRPQPPPPPPMTYKIKELTVNARIVDSVARVQVGQSFVNTGSRQMEVCFVFPLPYDGAVDQLTFMVDGKEIPAKLLPAGEARSIYEGYVRRNQDPALLEWIGTGMFKTSVFPVPPGAERKVALRYNQLLRKDHHVTDFLFPLSTAKYTSDPIEKLTIEASIESSAEIKSVYSPTHEVAVKRSDDHHATVKFEIANQVPASDFRLFFDTVKGKIGASVLSYRPKDNEDGFFLMMASPKIQAADDKPTKKTAIIVVDRSGSMSGKKIEQAKEALKFVLNNLNEGDTFNVIAYDSSVESFKPELQKLDDATRKAALGFVEGLYAGGSTNIDGALTAALGMIQDHSRPSYVIFLTDGLPTAGETNELKIVDRARQNNKYHTRLVSFGVGYDLNSRLLDRLSRANFGASEFVRPDENIEQHVSRLYSKISSPVMTDVAVTVDVEGLKPEDGQAINRVYPSEIYDIFQGEQLLLVGRYKKPGQAKIVIRGKVGDASEKMDFPADLVAKSNDESYAFVEKVWAMRRIGQIIDELDLKGQNEELVKELVSLSTQHGILTPYTSFLADENAPQRELADARFGVNRANESLSRLREVDGLEAFAQRAEKKALQEGRRLPLAANAPAADAAAATSSPAGIGGGAGPAGGRGANASGGLTFRDTKTDQAVVVNSVQNVGKETLYKRGNQWFATNAKDIDLERDKDKVKEVTRFSDEYFKLIDANTAAENAVLSRQQAGEELVINLRGQVYLIK